MQLNRKIAGQKPTAYATFLKNFTEATMAVVHEAEVSGKDADHDMMLARDQ
jgi:hypothetical protein